MGFGFRLGGMTQSGKNQVCVSRCVPPPTRHTGARLFSSCWLLNTEFTSQFFPFSKKKIVNSCLITRSGWPAERTNNWVILLSHHRNAITAVSKSWKKENFNSFGWLGFLSRKWRERIGGEDYDRSLTHWAIRCGRVIITVSVAPHVWALVSSTSSARAVSFHSQRLRDDGSLITEIIIFLFHLTFFPLSCWKYSRFFAGEIRWLPPLQSAVLVEQQQQQQRHQWILQSVITRDAGRSSRRRSRSSG